MGEYTCAHLAQRYILELSRIVVKITQESLEDDFADTEKDLANFYAACATVIKLYVIAVLISNSKFPGWP